MKTPVKAANFFEEFRRFALKGNIIDLAIGVIIGTAFSKIVDSLVKNIVMPLISILFPSQQSYLGWKVVIAGKDIPYGLFLGETVNFIIIALALFIFVVKLLGWVSPRPSEENVAAEKPALTREQELLTEIRDLLKTHRD